MDLYIDKKKRRDRLQICADILKVAKDPIKKTRLMYRSCVQYNYFIPLIKKLSELRLIEWYDNILKTTKEGEEFIRKIDGLYKFLGEY